LPPGTPGVSFLRQWQARGHHAQGNEGKTMSPTYWMSPPPKTCDVCQGKISTEFYDAKTKQGPWGCLCPSCFDQFGMGEGTGLGQHYKKQPDGDFLKISTIAKAAPKPKRRAFQFPNEKE
jgi:hypothetical protein